MAYVGLDWHSRRCLAVPGHLNPMWKGRPVREISVALSSAKVSNHLKTFFKAVSNIRPCDELTGIQESEGRPGGLGKAERARGEP